MTPGCTSNQGSTVHFGHLQGICKLSNVYSTAQEPQIQEAKHAVIQDLYFPRVDSVTRINSTNRPYCHVTEAKQKHAVCVRSLREGDNSRLDPRNAAPQRATQSTREWENHAKAFR